MLDPGVTEAHSVLFPAGRRPAPGGRSTPGALFRDRDGKVLHTMVVDVLGGRIQAIRTVINPGELGHGGPVADAWAVRHDVLRARRRTD